VVLAPLELIDKLADINDPVETAEEAEILADGVVLVTVMTLAPQIALEFGLPTPLFR
jgi:hypothetical protein